MRLAQEHCSLRSESCLLTDCRLCCLYRRRRCQAVHPEAAARAARVAAATPAVHLICIAGRGQLGARGAGGGRWVEQLLQDVPAAGWVVWLVATCFFGWSGWSRLATQHLNTNDASIILRTRPISRRRCWLLAKQL